MQTRKSTETQSEVSKFRAEQLQASEQSLDRTIIVLKQSLRASTSEVKPMKKRDDKRQIKQYKNQINKKFCLKASHQTSLKDFLNEYNEADEQTKARIHSHLLLGRIENKALISFAYELLKKYTSASEEGSNFGSDLLEVENIEFSPSTYKQAAKRARVEIKSIQKGILKKRFSDLDIANANLSLQRQIRAMKRSVTKQSATICENLAAEGPASTTKTATVDMSFQPCDFHYIKKTMHPERDQDSLRVIDQPEVQIGNKKPASAMKSSTRTMNSLVSSANPNQTPSKRRRIEINDQVEIYFYPENRQQHAHHASDYDSQEEDEERNSTSFRLLQEDVDPSLEELMLNYMQTVLIPRIREEQQEEKEMQMLLKSPLKRTRRDSSLFSEMSLTQKYFNNNNNSNSNNGSDLCYSDNIMMSNNGSEMSASTTNSSNCSSSLNSANKSGSMSPPTDSLNKKGCHSFDQLSAQSKVTIRRQSRLTTTTQSQQQQQIVCHVRKCLF